MANKQYKKIYCIYIYRWSLQTKISVYLVRDTKKTYKDITFDVVYARKDKGTLNWAGDLPYSCCVERLSKENEYKLSYNDYCVYMFGSNLERLKQAWSEATTPTNDAGFYFNSDVIDTMVTKLNNQEETETGELEDN